MLKNPFKKDSTRDIEYPPKLLPTVDYSESGSSEPGDRTASSDPEFTTVDNSKSAPPAQDGFTVPAAVESAEELVNESKISKIKEKLLDFITNQLNPKKFLDDFTLGNLTEDEKNLMIEKAGNDLREFIIDNAEQFAVQVSPNFPGAHFFKMMAQIYVDLIKQYQKYISEGRIIIDLNKIKEDLKEIKSRIPPSPPAAAPNPQPTTTPPEAPAAPQAPPTPAAGGGNKYKRKNKTKRRNKTKHRNKTKRKKKTKRIKKTKRRRN